jgi:hypothetical protein
MQFCRTTQSATYRSGLECQSSVRPLRSALLRGPVAFLHSRCFLDLSVTREELAVIDLQSKGFAIKRVRSACDGAVGDRVNPGAFLKIQVAASMGAAAVVSVRTKGTRRMSPI